MKKIYALALAAVAALSANAQDGKPLYITGDGAFPSGLTWNAETPDEFTFADGKYTITVGDLMSFKVSTAKGNWDDFGANTYGCKYGYVPGTAVELIAGFTENINCPAKATWTVTVAGDLSTITLTTTDDITIVLPWEEDLYLKGGMNDWSNSDDWKLTQLGKDDADYYVYKYVCDGTYMEAGVEFKIADANWAPVNIGAGENTTLVMDEDNEAFGGSNPANFFVEEDWSGAMFLKFNFTEGSGFVYFSNDPDEKCPYPYGEGAVKTLDSENAAAVYYNLQGVRVANAENGIFIVKKGDKVSKVYVK